MSSVESQSESATPFQVLMVEDDFDFTTLVSQVIRSEGGQQHHAPTLSRARELTTQQSFDLVLLDNHLPDGKAYDFYEFFARRNPEAPIIMLTGLPNVNEAIRLTRNGLFDYLTKPVDLDHLTTTLRRALLRVRRATQDQSPVWLGDAPAMRQVAQQLQQASRHGTVSVLLTGESGVGKDVAARALHAFTFGDSASAQPFVAVNCAAIPSEMFESELFGAERGAYTGADRKRTGLVAAAQGGTLFLDEIAEVPLPLQAKLLRFLENREFRLLGNPQSVAFTGRVIAATNKVLRNEVAAGRFREDLLFRLEVMPVEIPPLRDRADDIAALAEKLLRQLSERYQRSVPLLRSEDLDRLKAFSFPGNVRELRNILERGLLRTEAGAAWLSIDPVWLQANVATPSSAKVVVVPASTPPIASAAPVAEESLPEERRQLSMIEAQEYRLIRSALKEAKGGIRRTATQLGLSPQALLRRLEKWPELRSWE